MFLPGDVLQQLVGEWVRRVLAQGIEHRGQRIRERRTQTSEYVQVVRLAKMDIELAVPDDLTALRASNGGGLLHGPSSSSEE